MLHGALHLQIKNCPQQAGRRLLEAVASPPTGACISHPQTLGRAHVRESEGSYRLVTRHCCTMKRSHSVIALSICIGPVPASRSLVRVDQSRHWQGAGHYAPEQNIDHFHVPHLAGSHERCLPCCVLSLNRRSLTKQVVHDVRVPALARVVDWRLLPHPVVIHFQTCAHGQEQ